MAKQIEKIQKKSDENKKEIDNVQRFTLRMNVENYNKKIIEISIVQNYLIW